MQNRYTSCSAGSLIMDLTWSRDVPASNIARLTYELE
jgi:hypothetical protein